MLWRPITTQWPSFWASSARRATSCTLADVHSCRKKRRCAPANGGQPLRWLLQVRAGVFTACSQANQDLNANIFHNLLRRPKMVCNPPVQMPTQMQRELLLLDLARIQTIGTKPGSFSDRTEQQAHTELLRPHGLEPSSLQCAILSGAHESDVDGGPQVDRLVVHRAELVRDLHIMLLELHALPRDAETFFQLICQA